MDKTLIINDNGKRYRVMLRGCYQNSIRNEKRLREVVKGAFIRLYGEESEKKNNFFTQCSFLGMITQKWVIDEKGRIIR